MIGGAAAPQHEWARRPCPVPIRLISLFSIALLQLTVKFLKHYKKQIEHVGL